MHVTISQCEISDKNNIFSFKTKPSRAEKNSLEKAAFWLEVKVVCCLPTPLLHAKLITFQCIHVTDNDLADRLSAITRQKGGIVVSLAALFWMSRNASVA